VDEATEREHMRIGMEIITQLTGERPLGWYTGRDSPNTRRLVADYGGFEYDSDYYGDDLPFWMQVRKTDGSVVPQLIVPYTLDTNDMRFALPQGFRRATTSSPTCGQLRCAVRRGRPATANHPSMLSIGMHCRLLGRPGRMRGAAALSGLRATHDKVWICRRLDIARHWKPPIPEILPTDAATPVQPWTGTDPTLRRNSTNCAALDKQRQRHAWTACTSTRPGSPRQALAKRPFAIAGAAQARHGPGAAAAPGATRNWR
jgi:hypothetical protein